MQIRTCIIVCLLLLLCSCRSMRSNEDRADACQTTHKIIADMYGEQNCVLFLIESDRQHDIQIADLLFSGSHHSMQPIPTPPMVDYSRGQYVYNSNQCIGAVVNGRCNGSEIGNPVATCHGEMLNGQCTGPMF